MAANQLNNIFREYDNVCTANQPSKLSS